MNKKERFQFVIDYFKKNKPKADTELVYTTPYQLTVAVILSAQCTDKRVNIITPIFFNKFPDAFTLSKAKTNDVFEVVKSCSYPNNKTKNLINMAKVLLDEFNGVFPSEIIDLQKLPGVGRKTANVIASVLFNKPVLAVDTHVFRVAARIGLTTNAKTPLESEKQLTRNIPEELIPLAHHWLLLHGRYTCMARNPQCDSCGIQSHCKFYEKISNKLNKS